MKTHRETDVIALVTFLALQAMGLVAVLGFSPPSPVSKMAPPTVFSAERAMQHVRHIAEHPHPTESPELGEVRGYLLSALSDLGLKPEVQTENSGPWKISNIVSRISGTDSDGVILLAAHYDTVPSGPGAGDNSAAVAAMLEVCRAFLAEQPRRNDVIILFTDGEEKGLRGAKAFVAQHAWADQVDLVLNFDARGISGPSFMFQTSPRNGRLVTEFSRAVSNPVSSSLADRIYRLLPNNTDFTVFIDHGYAGFNFAFIDGAAAYHSPEDDVDHLSTRSLQHHGEQALALVRCFGDVPLDDLEATDRVYFTLPGGLLLHYSTGTARVTSVAVGLLGLALIVTSTRRKAVTFKTLHSDMFGILICFQVALLGGMLAWLAYEALSAFEIIPVLAQGESWRSPLTVLGLWNLFIFLMFLMRQWRVDCNPTFAIGLVPCCLLSIAAGLFMPEVSYLVTWPLAAALVALAIEIVAKPRISNLVKAGILLAAAVPIVILLLSHQYFFYIAAARAFWVSIFSVMVMAGFTFLLLQPQLELIWTSQRRWPLFAWSLTSAACVVAASIL